MFKVNPLLCTDGYKVSHHLMYPKGTELVFSNFTPRSVNYMPKQAKDIVVFGIQYTVNYISDLFNENFFSQDKDAVCGQLQKHLNSYLGTDYNISHFESLHNLGYLPVEIRGLDEGTVVNPKMPILTIHNTKKEFYWVTNFLETLISTTLWKPMHSASMSYAYSKVAKKYAEETDRGANTDFQCHDFSMRGMQSLESSIGSALGWMVCSKGTDTLSVLQASEYYYGTSDVGFSVPASEHAVMTAYGKEDELGAFKRILETFPSGIVSVVSDSFDLWKVCTEYLPQLKDRILARDGKLVIRPDSGDPVDIICGKATLVDRVLEAELHSGRTPYYCKTTGKYYVDKGFTNNHRWEAYNVVADPFDVKPEDKGVVELLWDVFGGTINEQGYKVLDSHIGVIYGDSITLDRMEEICKRLKSKGFASTNVVYGVGSYSLGYATRDNQGSAVKATYVEVNGEPRNIFKNPITDDGTKKSATGLLSVFNGVLKQECTWGEVNSENNELRIRFKDGTYYNQTTLTEIRERLNG